MSNIDKERLLEIIREEIIREVLLELSEELLDTQQKLVEAKQRKRSKNEV